ncbi:MAG: SCO family protein [Myxococcota bacterium]|nr:SCO family protein [Myxococcota bacterium]
MSSSRLLLAALLCAGGCVEGVRHYSTQGIVRDVNREYAQALIEHEEIPGFMSAMTMSFDVPDPEILEELSRGQVIDFVIAYDGRSYRVVEVRVLGDEGEHAAASGGLGALAALRAPAPPFELVDQAGRPVSSEALRGSVLLVDFVFTQCPGPCPILTSRHVALQRELAPALRERTRFVSISLDPQRDTPEALRAYAEARGADLQHWSFLTGNPEAVAEVVRGFGVGSVRRDDGTIDHLVATFIVDGQGRIAEHFLGLEHDTGDLRDALVRVSGG